VAAWTAERRAASRTDNAARWPAARGWASCSRPQRFAGGSGGVDRIGLGAVASGGPLGPVQFHHLLGVGLQQAVQAGAVAAGALDRPDALAWLLVGQLQQLSVAGRGGRHGRLLNDCSGGGGHDRGGVGVLVGVDPMTTSMRSASMCIALTPCRTST